MKSLVQVIIGLLALVAVSFGDTFENDSGWRMDLVFHSPFRVEIRVWEKANEDEGYWFNPLVDVVNQEGNFETELFKGPREVGTIKGSLHLTKEVRLKVDVPEDTPDPNGTYKVGPEQRMTLQEALAKEQSRFLRLDERLEKMYLVLLEELDPTRREALIVMQKTWAELRRRAALMDGTTDEQNNPIYNPAYWRTSANMTLYRIEWMRHFKGDLVSTEVTGSYLDGMGGILSIEKTEDGDWKFACNVVRGVSMDTGFVRGVAKVEGNVGTWVDTDGKAFVGARPATIELIHQDNWVRLIPQDTRYYQGARAYFDGTYLKVTDAVERFPQMNQAP